MGDHGTESTRRSRSTQGPDSQVSWKKYYVWALSSRWQWPEYKRQLLCTPVPKLPGLPSIRRPLSKWQCWIARLEVWEVVVLLSHVGLKAADDSPVRVSALTSSHPAVQIFSKSSPHAHEIRAVRVITAIGLPGNVIPCIAYYTRYTHFNEHLTCSGGSMGDNHLTLLFPNSLVCLRFADRFASGTTRLLVCVCRNFWPSLYTWIWKLLMFFWFVFPLQPLHIRESRFPGRYLHVEAEDFRFRCRRTLYNRCLSSLPLSLLTSCAYVSKRVFYLMIFFLLWWRTWSSFLKSSNDSGSFIWNTFREGIERESRKGIL